MDFEHRILEKRKISFYGNPIRDVFARQGVELWGIADIILELALSGRKAALILIAFRRKERAETNEKMGKLYHQGNKTRRLAFAAVAGAGPGPVRTFA